MHPSRTPSAVFHLAPNSRERILGIYQWYRVLSPVVKGDVVEVSWDQHPGGHPKGNVHGAEIVGEGNTTGETSAGGEGTTVYLQVVQWFKIRLSPFAAAPRSTDHAPYTSGGRGVVLHLCTRGLLPPCCKPVVFDLSLHVLIYRIQDLAALLFPPIVPLITLALSTAGVVSNIGASAAALIGFWAVDTKGLSGGEQMLDAE